MTSMAEFLDNINVEVLLALFPEELGPILLRTAVRDKQNGNLHIQSLTYLFNKPGQESKFSDKRKEIERALTESWSWLSVNGYMVPTPGINGSNGFMIISRKGEQFLDKPDALPSIGATDNFPKGLLHQSIAEEVYNLFLRGQFEDAVSKSFVAVEEAVRLAGNFTPDDFGIALMRKAFNKEKGKLSDNRIPKSEQNSLAELFTGAIGAYKNPHSHRTLKINQSEAIDRILLASHLLRIVDTRPIK